MRTSIFDFVGNLDTLIAVLVGALLATLGALAADLVQERLGRRRRQRDAARFFGEIMTSVDQIFDLACESQKVGDPWGAYSQRLFEIASREASVYERNRERLFDIWDMKLRFAINGHILRATVPIAGIVEHSGQIDALQARLDEDETLSDTARTSLRNRIGKLEASREAGLTAAKSVRAASLDILKKLEALGGVQFEARY